MDLVDGVVDFQGGYVSKILYVETKESGPLGGHTPDTPPRSANVMEQEFLLIALKSA